MLDFAFHKIRARFWAALGVGALAPLLLAGCGEASRTLPQAEGLDRLSVQVLTVSGERELVMSFAATELAIDSGIQIPIPIGESSDAVRISAMPDLMSNGTLFQIQARLSSLGGLSQSWPKEGLPGGSPLPDVRGGVLPVRNIQIGPTLLKLYLSQEVLGVYLSIPFQFPWNLGSAGVVRTLLADEVGNRFGAFYFLAGRPTGLLLLVPFINSENSHLKTP